MKKKGQIELIIIISIIIIFSIFLIFIFNKSNNKNESTNKEINTKGQIQQVTDLVENCMEDVTSQGIIFISSRGGYYNLPDNFFDKVPATAYYIYNNQKDYPELKKIENELSKYVQSQIKYCASNILITDEEISFNKSKVSINFVNNQTYIDLDIPISIGNERSKVNIDTYNIKLENNRFIDSYKTSIELVDDLITEPNKFHLEKLFEISNRNNFELFIDRFDDKIYIFSLTDNGNRNFVYNFAVKWR